MVLDIKPDDIVYGTSLLGVQWQLYDCALELALLGEVDAARELVNILSKSAGTVSCPPLGCVWRETGAWPDGTTEDAKSETAFARQRESWENGYWGLVSEGLREFDEQGLEACLSPKKDGEFADETTGWDAMNKGERLTKALDISLRLPESSLSRVEDPMHGENAEETQKVEDGTEDTISDEAWLEVPLLNDRSTDILNAIVARWNANQQRNYLAMVERVWPLCINGTVAKAIGADRAKLQAKSRVLIDTFSKRLGSGYAAALFAGRTIKELLDIGNENTLRGSGQEYWAETGDLDDADFESRTLFKGAATKEEISNLESKLGVTLPDDYKEFLRISNGFGTGDEGDGIYNGVCPDPALFGVDEVNWNYEEYFQLPVDLLDLPYNIKELGKTEAKRGWDTALPLFGPVLEIGVREIDNLWLVQPRLVSDARNAYYDMYKNANKEQKRTIDRAIEAFAGSRKAFDRLQWCCVEWSSGGSATMTSYASFRRYLEIVVSGSNESKYAD